VQDWSDHPHHQSIASRPFCAFDNGVNFAKSALEVAIGNESEIGRHPWASELARLAIALQRCASV
jgi:hypothetical protein